MIWHIWGVRAEERLNELLEYIENFPDGAVSDCVRHEVERLQELKSKFDS